MSSPQYMAQDPRTLLYYRFSEDGMQVIADVPAEKFMEKGSLFKPDHLIHLPPDTILTESDPKTNKEFPIRKGWKVCNTYMGQRKAAIKRAANIQRKKKKKLTLAQKAKQKEEKRLLKLSKMRTL